MRKDEVMRSGEAFDARTWSSQPGIPLMSGAVVTGQLVKQDLVQRVLKLDL